MRESIPVPNLTVQERARFEFESEKLRAEFGNSFKFQVSPKDEMYNHFFKLKQPEVPGNIDFRAWLHYFMTGRKLLDCTNKVLEKHIGNPKDMSRIMDFGCGYGRLSRFLVCHYSNCINLASDIDKEAVDFCSNLLEIPGIYSTKTPEAFSSKIEPIDIIISISVFSHLSYQNWESWFVGLSNLLTKTGVFLFTTHGDSMLNNTLKERLRKANGFFFNEANETQGRLETTYYGTTYVDPKFVSEIVYRNDLGELFYYPKGLNQGQDIYLLMKTA